MRHEFQIRVYYEDTDLAGIVYYANYLKYIERARSEFVRSLGIDQNALRRNEGVVFAVARIEADYRVSAVYDDILTVRTEPLRITPARLILAQDIARGTDMVFQSKVTLAARNEAGRPVRLPATIRAALA